MSPQSYKPKLNDNKLSDSLTLQAFQALEYPGEVREQREAGEALAGNRTAFLEALVDISAASLKSYKVKLVEFRMRL